MATAQLSHMTTTYGPASTRKDGLDAHEIRKGMELRARGLGWDAIAKILGRPRPDVQAMCDPDYFKTYAPARPVAAAKPSAPATSGRGPRVTPRGRLLAVLAEEPLTAAEVADKLEWEVALARSHLSKIKDAELIRVIGTRGTAYLYGLTAEGRKRVQGVRHG